jgi:hypothetical protein
MNLWFTLFWMAACKRPPPSPPPVLTPTDQVELVNGQLENGVWNDAVYGAHVAIPEGWTIDPKGASETLRLRMVGPGLEPLIIAIWRFPAEERTPRVRSDCRWDYQDSGAFLGVPERGEVVIASCGPQRADQAKIRAWLYPEGGHTWMIEAFLPASRLVPAESEIAPVFAGIDLGSRQP